MSTAYSSAKQQYIGNGVTTEWGFDFPIQKHSELKVYLKRSGSTQVLLEEGVDYSFVTENTIAFPIKTGEAKLQAADVLALQRESVFESEYNFSNQQRLEPEEVMHADDNLERQIQELKRDSESAIKVLPTSNVDPNTFFEQVERVYGSVDNIDTVANDKANVDAVSGSITNVNKTAGSIDNVNVVAPSISSVNTVAANISSVNTAASNMAAIKAAPTAASNAAQSAANAANSATISANSAIWAEGTDAQVAALGGVHSSKGWAQQSTSVNISLTNSPYTTNRILEIPQDIKLELNNGTLTLKAGSKVYVPNGFETDGTTPKFDVVTVPSDVVFHTGTIGNNSAHMMLACNLTGGFGVRAGIGSYESGSTAPSNTTKIWYDTTNNAIKAYEGGSWVRKYSLPIGIYYRENGNAVSIDQVFNGFGYIGSTVFALPGVKCQSSIGRNADGTCTNHVRTVSSVLTYEAGPWNNATLYFLLWTNACEGQDVRRFTRNKEFSSQAATYSFDENENKWYFSNNSQAWHDSGFSLNIVGKFVIASGKITSFEPYTVDSVVNSNEFYQLRDKAVTTDTVQTISGSKRFTKPSAGMSIEFTADTNQQTVPAETTTRQLGLYRNATYTKGDGYTSWLQGFRGSDGLTATELYTRRFLEGDSQEILNYIKANITSDGTPISYTKTPPIFVTGEEIVTAGWFNSKMQVVSALPAAPDANVFYFIPD